MKLFYSEEIRKMDEVAISEIGLPGFTLMETAGRQVAENTLEFLGSVINKKVIVFCGSGNNAGDAFACARYLYNRGVQLTVVLVANQNYHGDTLLQFNLLKQCTKIRILTMNTEVEKDQVKLSGKFADLVIDGILGTGFHGETRGSVAEAIDLINAFALPVVAIDLPSGVLPDSGKIAKNAVQATITVTMTALKPGLVLYPGANFAGKIVVADLGIPHDYVEQLPSDKELITACLVAGILPQRPKNAHKGLSGRVMLVAGSPGLTGAAALAGEAAVLAGAGLVKLFTPLSTKDILAIKLTEVMVYGLIERLPGILGGGAVGEILQKAAEADVLALGPGLGVAEATLEAIREVVRDSEKPLVLDADALRALQGHTEILKSLRVPKVLTPHPGEMALLTGLAAAKIDENRIAVAAQYAQEWDCVLVLKGAPTVVAWPNGAIYVNTSGNEGMATGGSGDVLTGLIAALMAQGLPAEDAAVAGVWLHGRAADVAAQKGKIGLTAGLIAKCLPQARQVLEETVSQKNS
ncbi:MAG TPA: NAD(P)H-hydrate dehydratase [Candidatus Avacidaminococcus intestinavium]|uniref:Bifunctional NAD(P)H-hydrate repair enzyme n=1 Tax=Candidatus Avacidaminococcus intestinavium TaxID=2840684 RepID=A0A9D1MQI0_9FIRM|nr:NAD(P)H-hydrate dehydratase [Candidatus Avacidaminococcus intestinavium]